MTFDSTTLGSGRPVLLLLLLLLPPLLLVVVVELVSYCHYYYLRTCFVLSTNRPSVSVVRSTLRIYQCVQSKRFGMAVSLLPLLFSSPTRVAS